MKPIYHLRAAFLIFLVFTVCPVLAQDYQSYLDRGDVMIEMRQYDQAIAEYTRAINLKPNTATAYTSRGLAHSNKSQFKAAIADFTRAIELDPKEAWAYGGRGLACRFTGQYKKAIRDFSAAIEMNPEIAANSPLYLDRGMTYAERLTGLSEISPLTSRLIPDILLKQPPTCSVAEPMV